MHYTPNEVRALLEQPAVYDVQTDRRRLRISNSVISPAPGEKYLLQVGVALDQRRCAAQVPETPCLESPRRPARGHRHRASDGGPRARAVRAPRGGGADDWCR